MTGQDATRRLRVDDRGLLAAAAYEVRRADGPPGVVVLELAGEVDIAAAPLLRVHVREAIDAGEHLVLDLDEVTFVDSTILHVLLWARGTVAERGARFAINTSAPAVLRLIELTRTGDLFHLCRRREDAVLLVTSG